jgi:FkbM family methyltransferase
MADHVCPFWVGYLLSSPIRKLWHNPKQILEQYIEQGMKVLDIGCSMGFFSLPMARMVGNSGKVLCIDIQEKMISCLEKRAKKAGLLDRIIIRVCSDRSLCLDKLNGEIDFALAFAVVHEVPDSSVFFPEIYRSLKPAGRMLMAEPRGRVSAEDFEVSICTAQEYGFKVMDKPCIRSARAAVLQKQGA